MVRGLYVAIVHDVFCTELRKELDEFDLCVAMAVRTASAKVRVGDLTSVYDVCMRKEADT